MFLFDAAYVPNFANASQIIDFPTGKGCGSAGVLGYSETSMITATAGYHEASATLGTDCDGNPLTLQSGGEYVLLTMKQTIANRLGYMDATNTVRVKLSDSLGEDAKQVLLENVVTARSMVPEPATWAMLIIGFGAVGMAARRQRSHAAA
ncbi:PEP-CTERM sorting domain-containing protein [Sandaracinobacter neustonicus]|uniref:PEP-CTERM sorting domain-containing protein n=1 Tax=Sandaracinobacter neustonicus TaxID=1715348 RepID=A0A501XQC6_9SPHN|nr:PEP-CTERM sorting domain-containing protein [Sandaracinobacter neustonicus]